MKKYEPIAYILMGVVFALVMTLVFIKGDRYKSHKEITDPKKLEQMKKNDAETAASNDSILESFHKEIKKNLKDPLSVVLIQVVVVLLFARFFSMIFKKLGQPSVIGEIFAGIALGPSFIGFLFPEFSQILFPKESFGYLKILSQIGLLIFMFIIGMELDVSVLKKKASSAIFISHTSIIFPYTLGVLLSLYLFDEFAPQGVSFLSFGLFMGIAMSITAFPVLARIIQERGLTKSPLGIMAITCAAVDDISAWCILAIIIAIVNAGTLYTAIITLVISFFFIAVMIFLIQPLLNRMSKVYITKEIIGKGVLTALLLIVIASAIFAEGIGIHALFGAFLAGVVMPANTKLRNVLTEKFEDFSTIFLLPLFFAFTGIRTKIGLLNDLHLWAVCLLIIIVAIIGKLVGSMFASRFTGMSWRDSFAIGVLMNTRGLMELIVLNIGYDLGIISPTIFVMMVLMALVTTFITGPLLKLSVKTEESEKKEVIPTGSSSPILITFGPTSAGISLLKLASGISGKNGTVAALHLSPVPENISITSETSIDANFFAPLESIAKEKKLKLKPIFKVSDEIPKEISATVRKEQSTLVLMGAAKRVFGDNVLGGKVESVLSELDCTVGVFLDRNINDIKSVAVFYSDPIEVNSLLHVASQIYEHTTEKVYLINDTDSEPDRRLIKEHFGKIIPIIPSWELNIKKMASYSLVIVGYKHWNDIQKNPEKKLLFAGERQDFLPDINVPILILRG
ncbi:MAG TPA: cation:proton antiporter [Leptospiraceae bacterium]|nr:cation:proton antiporter [Leptospiraceae bacterium]HMW06819.1 cation:proton antiporter [Leptospiraceae bacterium]HMX32164.1 cation:proton antiporter [Leptospiraceae bacterium]HMY32234.1 cation:proton antiporter [Leptospiraceae bacterium]HMZ63924.1 cation:proton antiporter [Leptospiraceae bacterium]